MADRAVIEIEGLERLEAKLKDPKLIHEPLGELIEEAAGIGRQAAEMGVDGGTGIAVRSIGADVKPASARIFSAMAKARVQSIDEGRKPGDSRWLSFLQVAQWLQGRRLGRGALTGITDSERAEILRVQDSILRFGAKGKRFFETTRQAVEEEIPRLMREMAKRIEGRWER